MAENLNLNELDSLIQALNANREKLKEKQDELKQCEKLVDEKRAEVDRLKKLALISERSFDSDIVSEKTQREEIETEINNLQTETRELEKQIAKGITEIKFPIKDPKPEISKGDAIFCFEEDTHEDSINYLRSAFNMTKRLVIDNVLFCPDRIVVMGTSELHGATDCLLHATQTIWALGSIMLGKEPGEIKNTLDFLRRSKYKHLWEFIGSRVKISNEDVYSNFGLKDETERKRARTFYSQLESRLTPPPVTGDGKGNFQLTTYGRLVWASYKKKTYAIPKEEKERVESVLEVQEAEKIESEETTEQPTQTALQNFFEKVLLKEG